MRGFNFCGFLGTVAPFDSDTSGFECYEYDKINYIGSFDVMKYFGISPERYRLLVRDGYLNSKEDYTTVDSFFKLQKLCKAYVSNPNNNRATNFPPLSWLKKKWEREREC